MNDDLMMREVALEDKIMSRIGKAQNRCYAYMSGLHYKDVRICYYWNDEGGRRLFEKVYPLKITEMTDEEITEMFFLDWVFR